MLIETTKLCSLFDDDSDTGKIAEGIDYEYRTCENRFEFMQYNPSGLVALRERPNDQSIGAIYPDDYEPYRFHELTGLLGQARAFVQKRKVRAIQPLVPDDAKILDLGCGAGTLLLLLKQYGAGNWELHGNDLHKESLARLSGYGIRPHHCDYRDLGLPGYFDLIILNQFIEHLPDPRDVLRYCRLYLKPTGRLFIETPSISGLDFHLFKRGCWGGYHIPRHFYLFNEANLKRLLLEEGYADPRASYLASPVFWMFSFHHYFYRAGMKRCARLFQLRNIPLMMIFTLYDTIVASMGMKTSNIRMVAKPADTPRTET